MILVTLLALGAAGLSLLSDGSTAAPAKKPALPAVITQSDSGKTFTMRRTTRASSLRLSNKWIWTQPSVRGGAVTLTRVNYERDPGFKEWAIRRRAAGTATIKAYGRPNCDSCVMRPRSFSVKISVTR